MKKFIRLQILFLLTFSNLFAGEIGKELPPPVAGFTVSNNQGGLPNQGCGPLEITFTSTSISPGDPIVSYEWTFGDGTVLTTNDHTVTHTYTTGGKFEASLTITTSSLATSKYDYPYNIYVNVPNLGPDREFCMNEFGEEATFISSSTDGSFHTVWNDGYIGVARNLQAPGIYWVEATDQANGCSRRDTVIITAKPLVDVKYGYTELSNCGGAVTLRFVDSTKFNTDCGGPLPTSVNYLSEIMSGPAHVYEGSTDQNPEYTFTTEGTYEIWLGIEDGLDWHDYIMSVDIVFADANPPTAPTFTNQTICAGGSVALDAGYELGVTYSWLPTTGLSNPNIHNPVASPGSTQTYTVTKTKCGNSVTGSVTVTVGQPFTVDLGGDRQFCKTQFTSLSTGITDATSTSWGSDGDPTFASRGGSSSMVGIIPNTPGNYWVTVVKDGCTVSDTINISIVNSVLVNLSYSQPDACFPNRVQFNSDPGTSSSCGLINQYKWDFGDGTVVSYGAGAAPSERNPLHIYASPGTYNVRLVVFNDIGDSTEATTVVNVAAPGFDVNLGNDATICAADMITLDAGDFPGATYLWSTGESTQTIQASTAGEYWVEVTVGACSSRDTVEITVAPALDVDLGADASICSGSSITLDAGEFPGADYSWSTGESTRTISVNAAGTYMVTVTRNGCSASDSKDITVNTVPVVDLGADASICSGSSITLDAGEFPGADYSWSTGESTRTISVNAAGTYTVTVTQNGCSASDSKDITVNAVPVVDLGADASICSGSSITLDAGDFPGADYSWSTGESTRTISVNAAGTYTVTVTQNGCSASDSKDITENAVPVVDLGADASICSGSSITLDAGDFPGADYSWSTGESTRTISVNSAGTYMVTVTRNGCSASDSKDITVNTVPVVDLGADASICSGSSITLDAGEFPGADYSWSTGESTRTISVSAAGTYIVTVTRNGCSASDSKDITENAVPVVDLGADASICSGSSITLDAGHFPGADYSWSTGESTRTISVNSAGTYMVTVTRNGCSASDSKDITVNTVPVVDLGADASICSGSSITLDAGEFPGADYSWSTGESTRTISVSAAGTYMVTVTRNGCSASDSKDITVNTVPVVDLGADASICSGSSITLDAGDFPGADYSWSTGESTRTISVSAAGTYTVTVTRNGCSASDSKVISVATLSVDLGEDILMCKTGGFAVLKTGITGAQSTTWGSDADPSFAGRGLDKSTNGVLPGHPGKYWVAVVKGGCTARDTVNIGLKDGITVEFTSQQVTSCYPYKVQFNSDPSTFVTCGSASIYRWDFGDGTIASYTTSIIPGQRNPEHEYQLPGTYNVRLTVVNSNDDSASYTLPVVVTGSGAAVDLGDDVTICSGTTLTLDAGEFTGATYEWSNGSTNRTLQVTESGNYRVFVTVGGCTTSDDINVTVVDSGLPVDLGNDTTVCVGSTITLDAGYPGATYLWSNGATTQTISPSVTENTVFTVAVSRDGCSGNGEIRVNVTNQLPVTLGEDVTLCVGESLVLDAGHSGADYLWHDGVATQTRTVTAPGEYSVTVTDGGCSGTASIQITMLEAPAEVDLGSDTTLCFGNTLVLDAGHPGATYLWSTGATTQTIMVSASGTYSVDVTACGTTVSGSIQVTASSAPAPSISLSGNELIASTADTYQWYKDGQLIPGATAKKLKPKGYGNYTVQVGSSDCVGEASYFFVPSGEIYLGDIRVKVTPNPSYGQPKLILSKLPGKPVQVSVFDRIGRKVLLTHIVNTVNELNLTGLARGEYFAELVLDDKRVIVKIITQ